MKKKIISLFTMLFILGMLSSCVTASWKGYKDHLVGTNQADEIPWGVDRAEILDELGIIAGATSQYPFLLKYRYRWVDTIAGIEMDHAYEDVEFWFNDDSELSEFRLTYKSTALGKNVYFNTVIDRADVLIKENSSKYGEPDDYSSVDVADSKSIQYFFNQTTGTTLKEGDIMNISAVWENVPMGIEQDDTRVELDFSTFHETARMMEYYKNITLAEKSSGIFRDLYTLGTDEIIDKKYDDINETIPCRIVFKEKNNLFINTYVSITPIYFVLVHPDTKRNDKQIIEYLIDSGADVNEKIVMSVSSGEEMFTTALHKAAGNKQVDIAKVLLKAGADPDLVDENYNRSARNIAEVLELNELLEFMDSNE